MRATFRHITFCVVLCVSAFCTTSNIFAQSGSSAFAFMQLPMSARLNMLGGKNVSMSDGELSMSLNNPALLDSLTDKTLQLNYAYLMQGINVASAIYAQNLGLNRFGGSLHYVDYGRMEYADEYGQRNGRTFTAKDIVMNLMYARQLGECFSIGVSLKPIYSIYEHYFAFSLGADVGAHYQTRDKSLQVGIALQNIGWQLKGFYSEETGERRSKLPLDLQLGINYRLKHAPLRFGMTIHDMQTWDLSYQQSNMQGSDDGSGIKWYDMMFRHTIFFLDIVPKSDRFYLTLSYNHQRRQEMSLRDQRSFAGFAVGGGVRIKQFALSFAFSEYAKGEFVYQVGFSTNIKQLMK